MRNWTSLFSSTINLSIIFFFFSKLCSQHYVVSKHIVLKKQTLFYNIVISISEAKINT